MAKASKTMGSEVMGSETMGSYGMKSARLHTQSRGFTLIASLLMLLLLSGIAIGLMMMVSTEGKVGGTDLQNNVAFHAAEGGIEKMASDLNNVIQNVQVASALSICNVGTAANEPAMTGVTWRQYSVTPAMPVGTTCATATASTAPVPTWGTITGNGPNAGLYAQIIPITMQASASMFGGQEVDMTRSAQIALIPVFQFGMFCDSDCAIFPGSGMTFAGPVHTNGDFYPFVGSNANLTFQSKVSAYGNIVRTVLPNTNTAAAETGTVYVPTAASSTACSNTGGGNAPSTAASNDCTTMAAVGTDYGDGSLEGLGGNPPQSTYSPDWTSWSKSTTNLEVTNGNYGNLTTAGTGAKNLSMPFVNGTNFPYELIRRPPGTPVGSLESSTSILGSSREYSMAQIHVLLSDDPAELPGGASDSNNVRLANIPANSAGSGAYLPYGIATSTAPTGTATLPTPASGTYNTYFATASNGVPSGTCTATATSGGVTPTCLPDRPYPPAPWTAAMMTAVGGGTDPNCTLLCPTGAPFISLNDNTVTGGNAPALSGTGTSTVVPPTFTPCPPATPTPAYLPTGCPVVGTAPSSPYYAVTGYLNGSSAVNSTGSSASASSVMGSNLTPENYLSSTWNLIDGWLRVEYLNNSGQWVGVTNEWLGLGFARDVKPPTANWAGLPAGGTSNPINPKAILLLQEPADRFTQTPATLPTSAITAGASVGFSTTGTAPSCTATTGSGAAQRCTAWSITPPQVLPDQISTSTTMNWVYGVTTTTMAAAPASSTLGPGTYGQSLTRFNWYPINFYDPREGEPRDINWSGTIANDNSCTTNGVMNAVELDVGNLKQWLLGNTGTSGKLVNSSTQNGYILYFSDRRGMLLNPNGAPPNAAGTKSGDSGLEDTFNVNGTGDTSAGTPDGVLEPKVTSTNCSNATGKCYSPEDDNENGVLDNWGADNLGLGFYGTVATPVTTTVDSGKNLNNQIMSTAAPDPYGTIAANGGNRIASCTTSTRKNWVSGARHVLKLVDGALGNVPLLPAAVAVTVNGTTTNYWGGFTVASENPVYIQGDYNSSAADTTWNTTPVDEVGSSAAAGIIADAVTLLSNNWDDRVSFMGLASNNTSPTDPANRAPTTTYYRVAIAAGKNMTDKFPSWTTPPPDDFGTDGGIHNFLHLMENWGNGSVEHYKGSLASMYFSTYNTGFYKCCTAVYGVPTRDFWFDLDFEVPQGLPPGTPMFKDVEMLGYRQLFAARLTGQ